MHSPALPGDPIRPLPQDTADLADSLVDAILDAREPSSLTASAALKPRGPDANPTITCRLHGVEWTLASYGYYRTLGELARRSRNRPLHLPSLSTAIDTILAATMHACRLQSAFIARSV